MSLLGKDFGNAIAARTSRLSSPATSFISFPEPKPIGIQTRGLQMIAGNFLFAGELVEAPETSLWAVRASSVAFVKELHGFGWLDHTAAVGTTIARQKSQGWLWKWIAKYGTGRGPGWVPQLTGRRVLRWVSYADFLLQDKTEEETNQYYKSLTHQAVFLSKRWQVASEGLPRFEALVGLVFCGLALETKRTFLPPALKALGNECKMRVGTDGSIKSRNPEELMALFNLLTWTSQAVADAGYMPHREQLLAMERIVPTLRALRLGGGGLAQFHGGGRGAVGLLDQSLADARIRIDAHAQGAMGYSRMSQSGTTIIVDTGAQPIGERAHISPLALELSSGMHPIFANIGPGHILGEEWHDVSAQIVAHNGVSISGGSPNTVNAKGKDVSIAAPSVVRSENEDFQMLVGRHQGYVVSHGMDHYRSIDLSRDGRLIRGRDRLIADNTADQATYDLWRKKHNLAHMPIEAYFHVSPDVAVESGMGGKAVSLTLPNGMVWVFQAKGSKLELNDSISFELGRLKMRATKQIVVTSQATDYEGVINWSMTRG